MEKLANALVFFLVLDFRQTLGMKLFNTAEDVICEQRFDFFFLVAGFLLFWVPYTSPIVDLICHFNSEQNP